MIDPIVWKFEDDWMWTNKQTRDGRSILYTIPLMHLAANRLSVERCWMSTAAQNGNWKPCEGSCLKGRSTFTWWLMGRLRNSNDRNFSSSRHLLCSSSAFCWIIKTNQNTAQYPAQGAFSASGGIWNVPCQRLLHGSRQLTKGTGLNSGSWTINLGGRKNIASH